MRCSRKVFAVSQTDRCAIAALQGSGVDCIPWQEPAKAIVAVSWSVSFVAITDEV